MRISPENTSIILSGINISGVVYGEITVESPEDKYNMSQNSKTVGASKNIQSNFRVWTFKIQTKSGKQYEHVKSLFNNELFVNAQTVKNLVQTDNSIIQSTTQWRNGLVQTFFETNLLSNTGSEDTYLTDVKIQFKSSNII